MNIRPLADRIIIKAAEAEVQTASGLYIAPTAQEKPQYGSVIAVGPGTFRDGQLVPLDVQVGDTVVYSKFGGTEIEIDDETYLVMTEREVLGIKGE